MRYPDWPTRLSQYVIEEQKKPFKYGEHDCCTFLAGAVIAMTGEDRMAEFRGKYDSRASGAQALREIGNGTLMKTLYKKFGKPVPGAHGRRGDIALYESGALGLVLGRYAIFLGEDGYQHIPISQLKKVFRVD